MKMKQIKELTDAELEHQLGEMQKERFNLRMQQKKAGQLENPAKTRQVRRDIARLMTESRARVLAATAK